jgi:amino acid adenylation domain-containing protein
MTVGRHRPPQAGATRGIGWELAELERSISDRFARVVADVPERLAVSDGPRSLSYSGLAERANGIAHALIDSLGPGEEPVAVYGDLETGLIEAVMGVLAAGKAYVPIDPSYPAARVQAMVADAGCRLVVTTKGTERVGAAPLVANMAVIDTGAVASAPHPPSTGASAASMLNVIYTSGSTGRPKGVVQVHRNMLNDCALSQELYGISVDDRIGLIVPITFGASVSDVLGALLNGASLHLADLRRTELDAMARWMREERITITHAVPTVFRRWMGVVEEGETYPDMRLLKLGGEPLRSSDLRLFAAHFPADCVLRNALGSTETYMVAAEHLRAGDPVDSAVVPVGFPVQGRKVTILGEDGVPVPAGVSGQIAVTTRFLSPGYWRDPEATAAAFLPATDDGERTYLTGDLGRLRPDGRLEHLGRLDEMIKIRGQRVEPAEVETAMLDVPGVSEAAVAARPRPDGTLRLIGYFVADGPVPATAELRILLRRRLPVHMIPSTFVPLARLPLLPFGKVDHRALPEPDPAGTESESQIAPRTPLEAAVASIVTALLGIDAVGVEDDLFSHGLDSLLATQLAARLRDALGVEVPVETVFEAPTVGALAAGLGPAGMALEQILDELEALDEEQVHQLLAEEED